MLAGNQSVLAVVICSCSCLSLPTLATRNVLQRSLILLVLAWNRTWSLHNLLLQLVNASANALPNLTVTGILSVLMGNVFFQQLSFFLRKTLGNKRWTFPYQLFFLSGSWPGSWGCVLALLARHISPRVSPGGTMLSLLLLPRVTDKLSPVDVTRGIQGAQPLAHYTFFFSPKRRPFLYFIPPSCLPGDPPANSQCCPGGSLQPAASSCLQNYLIFSFGFFTREKPLQDLQLSWQFSVLTERLCLFSPGSPSQHSSAFNSLLLCQDSLQEWGLL